MHWNGSCLLMCAQGSEYAALQPNMFGSLEMIQLNSYEQVLLRSCFQGATATPDATRFPQSLGAAASTS